MKKLIALITALILVLSSTAVVYGAVSPQGKKEYLVAVYNNVTAGADAKDSVEVGKNYSTSAKDIPGYIFVGWNVSGKYDIVSGSLSSADITLLPKSDLILTAIYTMIVDMEDDELKVEYTHNIDGLEETYEIIKKGAKVDLITSETLPGYAFIKWEIYGEYELISGSLNDTELVILPLGNVVVKRIFEEVDEEPDEDQDISDGETDDKEDDKKPPKGETNDSDKSPQTGMMLPIFGLLATLGAGIISKTKS